jgi:membrane protein DedA with SNARE-associated domain
MTAILLLLALASGRCTDHALGRLERLGSAAILVGRFSAGVRLFAAALAGSGRVSYWRFVLYDAAGSLVYAGLCLLLGHLFGARVLEHAGAGPALLIVLPLALGGLVAWRLARRRRHGPATASRLHGSRAGGR